MNTVKPMYEWSDIPWQKLEKNIYKLQKRIYKASQRENVKLVRRLQKLLVKSWSAKTLSVRRVTQDNQGKKTAGVDGIKSLSPKARLNLITKLKLGSKAKPTRRVWIPKPGKEEKRPLGIPTIEDRALQGLIKLALEPEWEAKFEPDSHGFRPGRSCHDAINSIFDSIKQKAKFVLDADIAQCFDRISHDRLLEKLNTFPIFRRQVKAWLKAGVMDNNKLYPSDNGCPQGGVISPLLANIALHGIEYQLMEEITKYKLFTPRGNYLSKTGKINSLSFIRYADDFVLIHEDIEVIKQLKKFIENWLNDIGLELKPSKTRICHTLEKFEGEEPGFDFLGFHIQQYKAGKHTSSKNGHGEKIGFKTIIKPSKEKVKNHNDRLRKVIKKHCAVTQVALIDHLNPIIRGWTNYYSHVVSKKVFSKLDHHLFWKLIQWGKKRHNQKSLKWVVKKYFKNTKDRQWVFATKEYSELMSLIAHKDTKIIRHQRINKDASPYDGNLVYWSTRMGKNPQMPKRTASLLKQQKGKCAHCKLYFREDDVIETDHIISTAAGGKDEYKNLQLLHRHCHDKKTKSDLKLIKNYQRKKRIEEFYKWFNKQNWIWKEDIPTMI